MQVARVLVLLVACGGPSGGPTEDAAADDATTAPDASSTLGTVTGVMDIVCPGTNPN